MRTGMALAALGVAVWIFLVIISRAANSREAGLVMFIMLAVLSNLFAVLAGCRTTADCLSQEKRDGTLGLLFLTDLKGYDIVLGKLVATSLNTFYGLVAMFPILGICLLLGGVAPAEFWRVVLASINNLLFSLAAGMFCSAISKDERKAVGATFLVILTVTGLPALAAMIEAMSDRQFSLFPWFYLPSPGYTCYAAFEMNFGRSQGQAFYVSGGLVLGLTLILLGLSCWITPRAWQDRAVGARKGSLKERVQQWRFGSPQRRLELRRQLLPVNPMLWLVSREQAKVMVVWVALGTATLLWLWGWMAWPRDWLEIASIPTGLLLNSFLKTWLAGEASRRLAEDRHSGALELLLATPMSVPEILQGQRLALWRQFAWPTFFVLLVEGALLFGGLSEFIRSDQTLWIMVWLAGMSVLVWDLFTLSWVGMWMGLNSRNASHASSAALVRICVLPWLIFGLLLTFILMANAMRRWSGGSGLGPGGVLLMWFIISAGTNLLFGTLAKEKLLSEFRRIAMERFDARPSGAWGRRLGQWWARR